MHTCMYVCFVSFQINRGGRISKNIIVYKVNKYIIENLIKNRHRDKYNDINNENI